MIIGTQSAYCPECDKSISAEMYSPYQTMCEDCWKDLQADLKIMLELNSPHENIRYTIKDQWGDIYYNEFLTLNKEDIDDNMVKAARMDYCKLSDLLKDGFQIIKVGLRESEEAKA